MSDTTLRGWPLVPDALRDPRTVVNDALVEADADVTALENNLKSGHTYTQTYPNYTRTVTSPQTANFSAAPATLADAATRDDLNTLRAQLVDAYRLINALIDTMQAAQIAS